MTQYEILNLAFEALCRREIDEENHNDYMKEQYDEPDPIALARIPIIQKMQEEVFDLMKKAAEKENRSIFDDPIEANRKG